MTGGLIDLSRQEFWITSVLAVLVLTPIARSRQRKWAFATLNLGFLALLFGWKAAAFAGAACVLFVILRMIAQGRLRVVLSVGIGVGLLLLFILHKLPDQAQTLGLGQLSTAAKAIGFAYLALRIVEVTRAVFEQRRSAPDLASSINYLLPFHMLAAGPIQSYDEFADQPDVPHPLSLQDVVAAFERIASGLFKKFVLAFLLREAFLTDFQSRGLHFALETQLFFLWLYLDFSAYSDIAVGIGRLMGVATPENFNRPYLARNVIEFWERWHISLSMFIRRNLFIPIQLSAMRRWGGDHPLLCASFAFTVSFLLCGLWHDLSLNFLLWGAVQALGLVVTNLYRVFLQKALSPEALRAYLANRTVRWGATVLTYEFAALSLLTLFFPRY